MSVAGIIVNVLTIWQHDMCGAHQSGNITRVGGTVWGIHGVLRIPVMVVTLLVVCIYVYAKKLLIGN